MLRKLDDKKSPGKIRVSSKERAMGRCEKRDENITYGNRHVERGCGQGKVGD